MISSVNSNWIETLTTCARMQEGILKHLKSNWHCHWPLSFNKDHWRCLNHFLKWADTSSRTFPPAIAARMPSLLHFYSRFRQGSRDPDVAVSGGSQKVEDARVSVEKVDDEPDPDINPGELTFDEGTLLKFLSV